MPVKRPNGENGWYHVVHDLRPIRIVVDFLLYTGLFGGVLIGVTEAGEESEARRLAR
ncbi:MAG: hypothetical protein PHQ21_01200 [Firmicutes bacterium]|nr:hypothetical protein [Bacillota bacterium]MDD4337912.1 hypothetical protein [Bacillota bacterium]